MTERPEYRVLIPGQQHFDCEKLRASLSTAACGQRWAAAAPGAACCECPIGRLHHADHPLTQTTRRKPDGTACLRCGRTDLRLIVGTNLCVSCAAREAEWRKGRNAKGKVPVAYRPLHPVEVAVKRQDGTIELRLIEVRDAAEAVARVVRDLRAGSKIIDTPRPGPTVWNATAGRFEYQCRACREVGLVLSRVRSNGLLEHHCWAHQGDPQGAGWRLAEVRQPVFAMTAIALAAWLSNDPDLGGKNDGAWTPTPHPCAACGNGQLQARLLEPGGRWHCRCAACGATGG